MDLRAFLEEDMMTFLDDRLSVDYLREQTTTQQARYEDTAGLFNKDYEQQLIEALQSHDIAKAKKILHEVKDDFQAHPVGSTERKQLEVLLHSLYSKFKSFLQEENTFAKMERALDATEDSKGRASAVLADTTPPAIARAEKKPEEPKVKKQKHKLAEHKTQQELPHHTEHDGTLKKHVLPARKDSFSQPSAPPSNQKTNMSSALDQQFLETLHELDISLDKKDMNAAHTNYARVKHLYAKLSTEERRAHHQELLHRHTAIMHLMQKKEPVAASAPEKNIAPVEERKTVPEKKVAEHKVTDPLTVIEEDLRSALQDGDLHEAMVHYEELRAALESADEKAVHKHLPKMQAYHSHIMRAWSAWQDGHQDGHSKTSSHEHQSLDHHERRLSGKP